LFEGDEEQVDPSEQEHGSSLDRPLSDTNVGFKLLLKMGWKVPKSVHNTDLQMFDWH
jgi:hypothetical protein